MKEILEKIFDKKIESVRFNQYVYVYPKQYTDKEIYETEVNAEEPSYNIEFVDGSKTEIDLSELIVNAANLYNKESDVSQKYNQSSKDTYSDGILACNFAYCV